MQRWYQHPRMRSDLFALFLGHADDGGIRIDWAEPGLQVWRHR
jgi:hypothetical protein